MGSRPVEGEGDLPLAAMGSVEAGLSGWVVLVSSCREREAVELV
jgi:hypothetical protein